MLDRIQIRFPVYFVATLAVAAVTVLAGGNPIQVMFAPAGGIALGMATLLLVMNPYKLPLTATWGEVVAAVEKSRAPKV